MREEAEFLAQYDPARYAPVAVILNDSYGNLFGVSRSTPYPTRELARAVAAVPGFAA